MLGEIEQPIKKVYLGVSKGKIVKSNQGGEKQYFSYVEGTIEDVYQKERFFNGTAALFWYIDLRDGEELYSLSLPYISGVFKSIIMALASDSTITDKTPIRIECYLGDNGFTKVRVYADGTKLDWVEGDMPQIEEIKIGGKVVKDDSKRMRYIENLADRVKIRVTKDRVRYHLKNK